MDKNTLSTFGWIVVVVLIISLMIAFATPFGQKAVSEIQRIPDKLSAAFFPEEKSTDVGSDALEQETSTPHTHHYIASTAKSATCTEPGITLHECSCGDSYAENVDALGHTPNIEAATETDDKICTVCLIVLEAATGHEHSYAQTGSVSPTCTATGKAVLTCSCGDTKTITVPALGHNYTSSYSAWICHSSSQHTRTAACACGATTVEYGSHSFSANSDGEPVCSICGIRYADLHSFGLN